MRLDYSLDAAKPLAEQRRAVKDRIARLKEAFAEARAYHKARAAADTAGAPRRPPDARWEALAPFLEGKRPVAVHADRLEEIRAALAWAKDEGLRLLIVGGQDSSRLASELAAQDAAVIVNPVLGLPRRDDEPYDAVYAVPARLQAAGVRFAIATGSSASSASNVRNLPYHAGMAVAFGLAREAALRSITLSPAEILGVAERVGSLEPGKEATLFLADGDPLDIRTQVVRAFVAGREIDLDDRHKRLWRKYRERP
jgi:imidazolonepropionase-like amidohydrolase